MQFLDEIIDLLERSIKDDAQNSLYSGDIIKDGYSSSIDEDRSIISKGHLWISDYQNKLSIETGISTLRIKYNNNSGYFIEVPKGKSKSIGEDFIHKQSLLQVHRYTTSELQGFEKKLLHAQDDLYSKEYVEFGNIRNTLLSHFTNIYGLSRLLSTIDFYTNGAYISLRGMYSQVVFNDGYNLEILGGKHPIYSNQDSDFISNDLQLSQKDFIHTITGPNMGGKSTYLRQNALLILMAHIGYDIPCKSAHIPIVDKIFSRVGAGDNLYLGQSTFMVEMQEIGYILRNASKRSFIIIDEIGRGTSTYDGMSLAWSILEYMHYYIGAKCLFATHYHEIIDHACILSGVRNYSVAVGENNETIVFLRKVISGGIKKSYGIEVARLAGIPEEVLLQATSFLKEIQSHDNFRQLSILPTLSKEETQYTQKMRKEYGNFQEIVSEIEELNIEKLSPLECFQIIIDLKKRIKNQE